MVVGLVTMVLGVAIIVGVAIAKAEAYAYLSGLLVGELGAMLLAMALVAPGAPRTGVAAFFALSIAYTLYQLLKMRPRPGIVSEPRRPGA